MHDGHIYEWLSILYKVAPCIVQLDMLTEAVDTAAENPARFNLTIEEIGSRRKWLDSTRRQVHLGSRD